MRAVRVMLSIIMVGCSESPHAPRRPEGIPEQPAPPPPPAPTPPPAPPTPPAPAATFKVRVAAVTTGAEPDPDGYRVVVFDEGALTYGSDMVDPNGSTVFDLGPGSYYAHLDGIAPNCTAVEPSDYPIAVDADSSYNPAELLVTLKVLCLAIPATQGVRVTTVNIGTSPSTWAARIGIDSDSGAVQPFMQSRSIGANESVTMPTPAGSFFVYLSGQECAVASPRGVQLVRVEPNQMTSLTFSVVCGR